MAYLEDLDSDSSYIDLRRVDPELIGPALLCNISGTVVGSFGGAGDPITDLYGWKIFGPSGTLLFSRGPGAFQNINYTFITNGAYRVELVVNRGGNPLGIFSKQVQVIKEPSKLLESEYISCPSQPLEIQAIDPSSSSFPFYKFEWTNNTSGAVVSTSNTLITSDEGNFTVRYFLENSSGETTCDFIQSTQITNISTIDIIPSGAGVCVDGEITFETNPQLSGDWFIQKIGDPSSKKSFGKGTFLTIRPGSDLAVTGDYEILFFLENTLNPTCTVSGTTTFTYNPEPIFVFESADTSSGCLQADGKLEIRAITDLDFIRIDTTGVLYGPFVAGELIEISNLNSGTYNVVGGLGSCLNSLGMVVPLASPPPALEFQIDDIVGEACTENGKIPGSFRVTMANGPNTNALYRVVNERGGVAMNQVLPDSTVFRVEISGGTYFFEIYDENDECVLPSGAELIIPGKDQTNFQIPETINICQSFELTPITSQALVFAITRPDLTTDSKNAGEPILLDQNGEYVLVGTLPGQSDICPTERRILVDLIDPVDFEVIQVSEDCDVGNRGYEANIYLRDPSTVLFFWRNEQNEIIGTSQRLDLPPSSFGNYSLQVQPANSTACPIPPKLFLAKEPILSVDLTLEATKLCELGPKAIIDLSTALPDEVTNVEWRRYDPAGNIEVLSQFANLYQIEVDVEGTYEAAIFSRIPSLNKNCELGRRDLQLTLTTEKVNFEIPASLSICETYDFTPETNENLVFEITKPNGETVQSNAGDAIKLDQNGIYSFYGYNPDVAAPLCPEIKTLEVLVNQKIQFTPELLSEDCTGEKVYFADIGGLDTNLTLFTWYDAAGNSIGNDQRLTLRTYGDFSLDVQPAGSIPCDQVPVSFFVETPILSLPTAISAEPLCPDATSTTITALTDFAEVDEIQWWFTALDGTQNQLINENNNESILAFNEGTYEVRTLNENNCLLGFDRVLLMRSMDAIRPNVAETYQVCPQHEFGPLIDPGNFTNYEWYLEDQLVSVSPIFKPTLPGSYSLIVFSAEGCAYSALFEAVEECELRVSYPNAVQPGNPDKEFLIYTNYLIDEMKVSIFNKWGQLIYYCEKADLISEESTCFWDGTFDGEAIPNGNYAIRIDMKNLEKNISRTQMGSILIIE